MLSVISCMGPYIDREYVFKMPDTYIHYVPAEYLDVAKCDGMCVIHGGKNGITESHVYVRGVWVGDKLFVESQEIFGHELLHVMQHAWGAKNPD